MVKHGHHGSDIYKIWLGMRARCKCRGATGFKYYGGRGILVCPRWDSFENFLKDMGERPSGKHSIERINNGGNYEPSNCIWEIKKSQMRNTRRNVKYLYKGKRTTLPEIAEIESLNFEALRWKVLRDKNKMSISDAVNYLKNKKRKYESK